MNPLEQAKKNFLKKEKDLSPFACKSKDALRMKPEKEDIRSPFFHDADRILYDLSYSRYQNKTQVFSHCDNDHISKRMTHVQMVSKIARTIGRSLGLNEDLIEAIALGHDIGHPPLAHQGEAMLNKISQEAIKKNYAHNVQSVRYYMEIANHGKGLNLSIQTLDGILMHNGEILSEIYAPQAKTKEEFLKEYHLAEEDVKKISSSRPMTLEGCVVRLSDIIGYIGRDVEDAILMGVLEEKDLPEEITTVLGKTNREIINTLVCDIINESIGKPYIKLSTKVYHALFELKEFNVQKIYSQSMLEETYNRYEQGMKKLYQKFLKDIQKENRQSLIYQDFLHQKDTTYLKETPPERIVIDYLSGMTDEYFLKQIKCLEIE